jgi:hypothetical protein
MSAHPTALPTHFDPLLDPPIAGSAVDSWLAHVLIGEPDSTSPGLALVLADGLGCIPGENDDLRKGATLLLPVPGSI